MVAIDKGEEVDADARRDILKSAAKSVPLSKEVDLGALAADLDGYSAADCVALLREAALTAMRRSIDAADVTAADVATARDVAGAAGRPMLDAPVSGGTMGAEAATLTFMVGGPAATFAAAQPILAAMGRTIVHCGEAGAGQAAKACNNMMLAINMIAASEALVLAEKLGLSHQALFDVVSKSSGQSWAMTTYCPAPELVPTSPANRDYKPGFAGALMLKDLGLAQEAAAATGAASPLGAQALALYQRFVAEGGGDVDFSGIIRMLRGG